MTTHTIPSGSMAKTIFVAAPDLLDLVRKWLPGDAGTSAMFSITGGLAFRCASLAGMVANGLAADMRTQSNGLDSYNECMANLDEVQAANLAFQDAGLERKDMCESLTKLLAFKRTCDDYLAQLVGDRYRPTNWLETFTMVAQPRAVDQWMIDDEWNTYIEQLDGKEPEMQKDEFDKLSRAALEGPRALWSKHVGAVFNILEAADSGGSMDFYGLDKRTQFSMLTKYGSPEQLGKFRINVKKSMMGRPPMEILGRISLYKAFSAGCALATTHPRYNDLNGSTKEAVKPKTVTPTEIAAGTKARADVGKHAEYIAESVNAEKRAHAQAVIDGKARKPKEVSAQVAAKASFAAPKAVKTDKVIKPKKVKAMSDLTKLEPTTKPAPALTAKQIANQPIVDPSKTTTIPFVDMPNSTI